MSSNNLTKLTVTEKEQDDNNLCKKHVARCDKECSRPVCTSKLSKRELEDLYYSVMERNLELKRKVNAQNEKNRVLSTKVQRMTAQTKTYSGKDCCAAGKAVIDEQKAAIADLSRANEALADKIRKLTTQLCTAKQFLKQNPNARGCYKCFSNASAVKNLSSAKSSAANLKSATSGAHLDQEPHSTRTAAVSEKAEDNDEKGRDAETECTENKCKTTMEILQQKIEDLEEELAKTHVEYSSRMTELESQVSALRGAAGAGAGRARGGDPLDLMRELHDKNASKAEVETQLSIEKRKVAELEMRLKAAELSQQVARTLEDHLSNASRREEKQLEQTSVQRCSICSSVTIANISPKSIVSKTPTKSPNELTVPEDKLSKSDDSGYAEHRLESEAGDKYNKTNQELVKRVAELQAQLENIKSLSAQKNSARSEESVYPKTINHAYVKCGDELRANDGLYLPEQNKGQVLLIDPETKVSKEQITGQQNAKETTNYIEKKSLPNDGTVKAFMDKYDSSTDEQAAEKDTSVQCNCPKEFFETNTIDKNESDIEQHVEMDGLTQTSPERKAHKPCKCKPKKTEEPNMYSQKECNKYEESSPSSLVQREIGQRMVNEDAKENSNPNNPNGVPESNQKWASLGVIQYEPNQTTQPPLEMTSERPPDSAKQDTGAFRRFSAFRKSSSAKDYNKNAYQKSGDIPYSADTIDKPLNGKKAKKEKNRKKEKRKSDTDEEGLNTDHKNKTSKKKDKKNSVDKYENKNLDHPDNKGLVTDALAPKDYNFNQNSPDNTIQGQQVVKNSLETTAYENSKDMFGSVDSTKAKIDDNSVPKALKVTDEPGQARMKNGLQFDEIPYYKNRKDEDSSVPRAFKMIDESYDEGAKKSLQFSETTGYRNTKDMLGTVDNPKVNIEDNYVYRPFKMTDDHDDEGAKKSLQFCESTGYRNPKDMLGSVDNPKVNIEDNSVYRPFKMTDDHGQARANNGLQLNGTTGYRSTKDIPDTKVKVDDSSVPRSLKVIEEVNPEVVNNGRQLNETTGYKNSIDTRGNVDKAEDSSIPKELKTINELDLCQHHATICLCPEKPNQYVSLLRTCAGSKSLAAGGRLKNCACGDEAPLCSDDSVLKEKPISTSTPKADRAQSPISPHTYTVDSGKRADSPANTENEISVMTDLPSEKCDTYDRLSPGEYKNTTTTGTYSPWQANTLSEGEVPADPERRPFKPLAEVVKNSNTEDDTSYGQQKSSTEKMEATLNVISQELARCRTLLQSQRPRETQQKDAGIGPEDPNSIYMQRIEKKCHCFPPTCVFTLHVATVILSDAALDNLCGANLVLRWHFDHKTTMSPLGCDRVSHFNFSTQYELQMTEEVLEYLTHDQILIMITELDDAENPFATCSLPLRQVLLQINRKIHLCLPLKVGPSLRESADGAYGTSNDVGDLYLWCMMECLGCKQRPLSAAGETFAQPPRDRVIEITILWLALNENCESLLTEDRKLYVAYSFLGRNGAELETPVSLSKPDSYTDKCIFNFRKTFNLTDKDMKILRHMVSCRSHNTTYHNSKNCIILSVVSEPPGESVAMDCEDIGFAFLYLGDLLPCPENAVTKTLPVLCARPAARACGVLAVRVDGLDVLRACSESE